jgi:hypothetical protein
VLLKNAHFRYFGTIFKKIGGNHRFSKHHALKKFFLILEVSWNNFAKKIGKNYSFSKGHVLIKYSSSNFFGTILIEKLGENHRFSKSRTLKKNILEISWNIFLMEKCEQITVFSNTMLSKYSQLKSFLEQFS